MRVTIIARFFLASFLPAAMTLEMREPPNHSGRQKMGQEVSPSVIKAIDKLAKGMDERMEQRASLIDELKGSLEALAVKRGQMVVVSDKVARGVLQTIAQLRTIRDDHERLVLEELMNLNFAVKKLVTLRSRHSMLGMKDAERIEGSIRHSLRSKTEGTDSAGTPTWDGTSKDLKKGLPSSASGVVPKKLVVQAIESFMGGANRKQSEALSTVNAITLNAHKLFGQARRTVIMDVLSAPKNSQQPPLSTASTASYSIAKAMCDMDVCLSNDSKTMLESLQELKSVFGSHLVKDKDLSSSWTESQLETFKKELKLVEPQTKQESLLPMTRAPNSPITSYRALFRTVLQQLGNEDLSTLDPLPPSYSGSTSSLLNEPNYDQLLANVEENNKETLELIRSITRDVEEYVESQSSLQRKAYVMNRDNENMPSEGPLSDENKEEESGDIKDESTQDSSSPHSEVSADGLFVVSEYQFEPRSPSIKQPVNDNERKEDQIEKEATADGLFVVEEVDFLASNRMEAARNNTSSSHYNVASSNEDDIDAGIRRAHDDTMGIISNISDRVKDLLEKNRARQQHRGWEWGRTDDAEWEETELTQAILGSIFTDENK